MASWVSPTMTPGRAARTSPSSEIVVTIKKSLSNVVPIFVICTYIYTDIYIYTDVIKLHRIIYIYTYWDNFIYSIRTSSKCPAFQEWPPFACGLGSPTAWHSQEKALLSCHLKRSNRQWIIGIIWWLYIIYIWLVVYLALWNNGIIWD